jgi:hypothetical protein
MATVETANGLDTFYVDIPEEELAELRFRIGATRCTTEAHGAFANASSWNNVPQEPPEAFADAIIQVGGAK